MTTSKKNTKQVSTKDFENIDVYWCAGCGHSGALMAILRWCVRKEVDPSQLVNSNGIGCSSKVGDAHRCNNHHWLHGRSLPIATAIKAVNPKLVVLDAGGDGDGAAIGAEHTLHTFRRNPDITYFFLNNQVYGLTKGQIAPTGHKHLVTPTTPCGSREEPVDMCRLAITEGATFVARAYSYDQNQLSLIVDRAFEHKGFSFVEILSPCPTYHREPDYDAIKDWYKDVIIDVGEAERAMQDALIPAEIVAPNYNPSNKEQALRAIEIAKNITWQTISGMARTTAMNGKLVAGILYCEENKPTFEENIGVSLEHPIVELDLSHNSADNQAVFEQLTREFL